ncbi:MAG TPA: MarR family winged helix-turn-helix transcriptional regulator [Solirubrobacteraceae bacterium]|nr:MarR family winged helix-turn-helix transcriptional regulator [Solirubrobacteraceae bacterium]
MSLPLSALLSQAFVAFTIECDNEFEHQMPHRTTRFASGSTPGAPWLISMAMWAHCLRHVPEGGIPAAELARRARLSRHGAEMILKRMSRRSWGYLDIAPERPGAPRSAWLVSLTPAGRRAQQIWDPLADEITARWRTRFGASHVDRIHAGLSALVDGLGVALPEFMPITELGGNWGVRPATARDGSSASPGAGSRSDRPLYALLAGLLVAFAVELQRATGMSPVLSANVVRVLDDTGVPVRRLSELTGIAGMGIENSLSVLGRRGHVVVEPDPAGGRARLARLTAQGVRARAEYLEGTLRVEREWERRCGARTVHAVREAVELPLLSGLTPDPDGWRGQVPSPHTLPHFPFVSHRGGYPDGS